MDNIDAQPIATLTAGDIPQAMELSAEAGWNQLPEDWALFLSLGEVFGIFEGPELAATAAIMPHGESLAWISMVLTRQIRRGQGFGTTLLRHCLEVLERQNRTALLDATPDGERIYRQLGFEPLFGLHRWEGGAPATASQRSDTPTLPLQAIDIANAAFGASRTAILLDFVMRQPRAACMSADGSASLFARNGRRATQFGPLTAAREQEAVALLDGALQACAGPVFIDVADHAAATTTYLERHRFSRQRPFLRMARGRMPWPGSVQTTIAIAGPEFG